MGHVNLFAVMFNSKAEIIYCNGHFVRMTGLSVDEVIGRNWDDIFVSPWAGDFPLHHEGDLLTRDGERYWVRWNSILLRDSAGTMVGVASIGEDITERRKLERALLDASV